MEHIYEQKTQIDVFVQEDGYFHYILKDCTDCELKIHIDKRRNASLMFTYLGEKNDVHATLLMAEDAQAKVLFWNETTQAMHMDTGITCKKNAELTIGFGDITEAKSEYQIQVDLVEPGADCHLVSAVLASVKQFTMRMEHEAPYTKSQMDNFAIIAEHGNYRCVATGSIQKGAHDSVSHQATRGLTMSENQKSEIEPVLLIDENEVKASHATTLGQPDENQLYYLQSRGLSREQALGLLTLGYLMPITEVLKDETIQRELQEKIEEKVIRNV